MVTFPVEPVGNKIIAHPVEKQEEMIGSIIVPTTVNVRLQYAEVVVVTDEVEHKYKPGDIIMFPEGAGIGQMIKGEFYLWFQIPEIWGIWTND